MLDQHCRVLAIYDDHLTLGQLSAMLTRHGFEVVTAAPKHSLKHNHHAQTPTPYAACNSTCSGPPRSKSTIGAKTLSHT
jgi:hypothetical protein